jgi:hypothetical protein
MTTDKKRVTKVWDIESGTLIKTIITPQLGDPGYTIDPKIPILKWMEWAFFMP